MIWQAPHFQPRQLGAAVEHHPAELKHDTMEPTSQMFDRSADVAPFGGERHRKGVRLKPRAVPVQICDGAKSR